MSISFTLGKAFPQYPLNSTLSHATAFTASVRHEESRSRSRSPTKKIGDLRAAKPPIKVEMVKGAPQAVKVILNKFTDIGDGIGVLPYGLKAQLKAADREYRNLFFDDPTTPVTPHDVELLGKLQFLQDTASRCHELRKPEPLWGEEAFRPMLNLAIELENRGNLQKVQVENVVNQAGSSDYIKWLPQLAAVECKTTVPGTDGVVQLGIWMAALRKRLEGLMGPKEIQPEGRGAQLKPMPCLKAQGLDWKMYWCYIGDNGETMLYGPQHLGSTIDMKGMYQILKALQEIVKYGRDEYWPWFTDTVLGES
ncbi:hypothetical protein AJ80_00395 [Polytolypa hystricis UAMH7299]|uniref:PD-(D/E)XK nuclease-like domain-containing protein n=1 Tax=Polytolypa hystricis (strain UAMH7299) TaxID=1447883 RepID=A0A2B7Z2K3_POLH7|nr:hypothetical protein AJ80_00395 [Polytolypa hystricis UAMH7299]